MESDRHYFFEGLFIAVLSVALGVLAVWLGSPGHSDDVFYRIRFAESVSGLTVGDPVSFRGVDVGSVKAIDIDPEDSRLVLVEVRLRKEAPVKTDTRASLQLKGITGVVNIELNGGDQSAETLVAASPPGTIPEIPSERTGLKAMLDALPKVVEKFSALEDQVRKVVTRVGGLTEKVNDNPSLLLRRPEKERKVVIP